jgi:biopolymer transport protein ExbD
MKIRKPKTPITSLIDISLLLLIYFMLVTNYSKVNVVKVTPPSVKNCYFLSKEKTVLITITRSGEVFLNGKKIYLDELDILLRKYSPNTVFLIKADKETAFKNVVKLVDKLKSLNFNYYIAVERISNEE